jgi:hypothetical protein
MFGMSFDFFALGLRLAPVLVGGMLGLNRDFTASPPDSAPMPWCPSGAPWDVLILRPPA